METRTAHVLFLDIVSASTHPNEIQTHLKETLLKLVRSTTAFRQSEAQNEILSIDAGDGMALCFFHDPIAPISCAVELAASLRTLPELPVRMGLHVGPVNLTKDINHNINILGEGINTAKRVMDCGDAGHLLLSDPYAQFLHSFAAWEAGLHFLGECAVKHNVRLVLWNFRTANVGNSSRPSAVRFLSPIILPNPPHAPMEEAETVGGAVRLGSRRYITRTADTEFLKAISRGDSIVLVKGARQMGKTSLLARGAQHAREAGAKVIWTDVQSFSEEEMLSAETFLRKLAQQLRRELDLEISVREVWDPDLGPNDNLDDFIKRYVLRPFPGSFVWAIDELDRIFGRTYSGDIFGLFRSWHNRRAGDPSGAWSRLTLALSHSTEPHLFISDATHSPFNVGTQVALTDFTPKQIAELNTAYDCPIRHERDILRFHHLINGHPYLASKGLYEMQEYGLDYTSFEEQAALDAGPFGDHLRRLRVLLSRNDENLEAVKTILRGQPCLTADIFYCLRSAGILCGNSEKEAKLRCPLYASYLTPIILA